MALFTLLSNRYFAQLKCSAYQASVYRSSLSRFCRLLASAAWVRPAPMHILGMHVEDGAGLPAFSSACNQVWSASHRHHMPHRAALPPSRVDDPSAELRRRAVCCGVHLPHAQHLQLGDLLVNNTVTTPTASCHRIDQAK
jgi:hypothetical protein